MSQEIRVRLVPKSRDGESITHDLRDITPSMAKRYKPDPGRATEAFGASINLGLKTHLTNFNSLSTSLPVENVKSIFDVDLVEVEREPAAYAYKSVDRYLTARQELKVPDSMKDTIAYAYIPTPPEFLGMDTIPPNTSLYHLRLMGVLRTLKGSLCHRNSWTGRNVRIAMADTGFANHPFFTSQGYTMERVSTPLAPNAMIDDVGHGTGECANILVMAPDCHFIGVKHDDYSALALETSLAQNPQVIVNSWGWDVDNYSMEELRNFDTNFFNELREVETIINDAIDDGVVVIFSAGNGHRAFPASMPDVLAIGGVTVWADGALEASSYASSFRSRLYPGRNIPDVCGIVGEYSQRQHLRGHIMLPVPNGSELEGENLSAAQGGKGWGIFSGTSAAAPQAAGLAALMLSINPNLTPDEIKSILMATATDVTKGMSGLQDPAEVGFDLATGAGLMNAFEACQVANRMLVP